MTGVVHFNKIQSFSKILRDNTSKSMDRKKTGSADNHNHKNNGSQIFQSETQSFEKFITFPPILKRFLLKCTGQA
jgi:hypothetical protein